MGFPKTKAVQLGTTLPGYAYAVNPLSPIGIKWASIGGLGRTGYALGNETPVGDDIGRYQLFVHGAIFWSRAFGATYMSERVWRKWSSNAVSLGRTGSGEIVQHYLGYPTGDTHTHGTLSGVQEWLVFERGMIYVGEGRVQGSWVVYGAIYGHYRLHDARVGFLGAPISDEEAAPGGGRVSRFEYGDIYFHPRTDAHEVHGAILQRYLDLGGPDSAIGYPTSDEEGIHGRWGEIGRVSRFENGSGIYYSEATQAWEVYGAIWIHWDAAGGATGVLGFPTSGEADTPSSGGRFNEFQHGVIVSHGSGPLSGTFTVRDLQLRLFDFTVNSEFNVQVNVAATPSEFHHGRFPADDQYPSGFKLFDPQVMMASIDFIRANSRISVWMEALSEGALSEGDIGPAVRQGVIMWEFTINNVWGLCDTDFKHHNGSFDATFRVEPKTSEVVTDIQEMFWPFSNTETFKLTWQTYAQTFRDVVESDKDVSIGLDGVSVHLWEIFFYETFYNSMSEKGFCFGACVEAIYAREHRSPFIEPIKSNEFNSYQRNHLVGNTEMPLSRANLGDGNVLDVINVKQGYQIGDRVIEFIMLRWMESAIRDPQRAYLESFALYQMGNWPVLTLSKDSLTGTGHAIMPYEWFPRPDALGAPMPGQNWVIYAKNPNYALEGHDNPYCRIVIDTANWSWIFMHDDDFLSNGGPPNVWSGSDGTGGRLLPIPYSAFNTRPVTPGNAVMGLINDGVLITLSGDASSKQITDGYGCTFYRWRERRGSGGSFAPMLEKDVDLDDATRIPNMMLVPRFESVDPHRGALPLGDVRLKSVAPVGELYYCRPRGSPPRGHGRPSRVTAVGVLDTLAAHRETPPSSLTAVGILDTLAGSRNPPSRDQLHFEIQGQRRGKLCWSILAPRMSVSVIADVEPDLVDSIHLEDPGGHFQAVTLRFPLAAAAREVSLRVAGWRGDEREAIRTFALEGLTLVGGESIRVQVSDGGRELLVDNRGAAKTFELRLLAGVNAAVVAARPSVVLDAASVVRLTPSDWSPTAATTAPIRRDVLDQSWGQVVSSSVV